MYQPEFIARRPASRTSLSTNTFDNGIFFISFTPDLIDVDPFSGPRRFHRGLDNANGFSSVRAVHQRTLARFDRIQKRREFRAKWFFRWKLELVHRAFHRFDFAVLVLVAVLERFNFVL